MGLTVKTRRRNAIIALCAGLIAGAGTVAVFGEHAPRPVVSFSLRQDQDSTRGFDLLERMLDAEQTLSIEGDQTTVLYNDKGQVTSTQHILRDGARGMRIEYTSPPRMSQTVVVDNGETLWRYNGKRNRLVQSPSKLHQRMQHYPGILRAHKNHLLVVAVVGSDTVAGRSATVIRVDRKRDAGPIRTLWVDNATGIMLKIEMRERSGQLRSVTQFTSVSVNVPIPANAFDQPTVRPGAQIQARTPEAATNSIQKVQDQAGFNLLEPGYLPPGYRFSSAHVTKFQGRQMVHARYLGGIDPLSIFQTPQTGPDSEVTFPNQGVATMVIGGHRIVVVGNLSNAELRRVISSMK